MEEPEDGDKTDPRGTWYNYIAVTGLEQKLSTLVNQLASYVINFSGNYRQFTPRGF